MAQEILKEAKRLYDLGFAIHLLHAKSKRPLNSGWTKGPRASWEEIEKQFRPGMNIGVRLGEASKIAGHYLSVIDVDVKSKDAQHAEEVARVVEELTQGHNLPEALSGRGNNSRHYYLLSKTPIKPFTLRKSKELVKVFMPSSTTPSKRDLRDMTKEEIDKGLRIRPAWEIGIMGEGQQVVLPPSIHPDSGKPYQWANGGFKIEKALATISLPSKGEDEKMDRNAKDGALVSAEKPFDGFSVEPVDLGWLPGVSDKYKDMILKGTGVVDRSAMLLPIAKVLMGAGLSRNEILSILTDPNTFIGGCAYDHAKTSDRNRAARWVWNFTLKKVEEEMRAAPVEMFSAPIETGKELTFDEMKDDEENFEAENWLWNLDRTDKGAFRPTLKNIIQILKHEIGNDFLKRDVFSCRDFYTKDCPWGTKANEAVKDSDRAQIRYWLGRNWGIEPTVKVIGEGLTVIALENAFDPVLDWLNALPAWDGVERLDGWLAKNFQAKGDPEYLAQLFRKWICGMVLRIQKPGAHFPWMPIFEGAQGIGKSSFGRILVGDKYFLDWLPALHDKDAALALQGRWAVEMGELATLRKNEIEIFKSFVTRTVDKVRPPYGENWIESPRRCVFFGTTNAVKYLTDDSGNRRLKPCEVGYLNFEVLIEEREQLFAEAKWLLDSGFESESTVELTGDAKKFEHGVHKDKMVRTDVDLMVEVLADFFNAEMAKKDSFFPFDGFRINGLFKGESGNGFRFHSCLHQWPFTPRNVQFACSALAKLGATFRHTKTGNLWSFPRK